MNRIWEGTEREQISLRLYVKLKRCINSIDKRIADISPLPSGLTISQFAVLEALYFHGSLSQKVIASKVLSSTGNVTFVIDNLEKTGLVERTAHEDDRRIKTVALTQKGFSVIEHAFPLMAEGITRSMAILTDREIMEMAKLLKLLGKGQRNQE